MVQHRRIPRPTSDPLKLLADEIAELKKRLRQVETGATSSGAVVRSKAMLVKNGASIEFQDAQGETLFYLGNVGADQPDGSPQTGMILRRQDSSLAMTLSDPYPTVDGFKQYWALYDLQSNVIVGDDVTSGQGLARPWLNTPLYPTALTGYQSTTSTSFVTLWDGTHLKLHPRLHVRLWVNTDAGTSAEIRVRVDGAVVASAVAVPAMSWTTFDVGPTPISGDFNSDVLVEVQARVTGGGGTVRAVPAFTRGEQS